MGEFHAQRVVDDVADRRAVTRTGKAVRQSPVLLRIGDRSTTGLDIVQNFDRAGKAAA